MIISQATDELVHVLADTLVTLHDTNIVRILKLKSVECVVSSIILLVEMGLGVQWHI